MLVTRTACVLLLAFTAWPALAGSQTTPLRAHVFVSGLTAPVAFVQDPSDSAIQFVVQQGGLIRVIRFGVLQSTPFLNLTRVISAGGERGLLGMAVAPDYASSGRFYVNFTNPDGHTVVARFIRSAVNPLVADISSRFDLRWGGPSGRRYIEQPFANHNGGDLHFGPDGYLYIGMGDGGSGGDPGNYAQNAASLLGKMLRIDVGVAAGHAEGYVVPADNPFAGGRPVAALPEIWAFGLRNPWRFSFDAPALGGSGAMLIGDVGQGAWEEIDYQPPGAGGRNYGWSTREGAHAYNGAVTPAYQPLVDPILEYGRTTGRSVTGGVVNRRQMGAGGGYVGRYFYGDFITGRVWSVELTGAGAAVNQLEHTAELSGGGASVGSISAFGLDAQGGVYIVNYGAGAVLRVTTIADSARNIQRTDFDGDGVPEFAVYRPETGQWFIQGRGVGIYSTSPGDLPAPCACDGIRASIAWFRPSEGTWQVASGYPIALGAPGDVPVPADYDGSGVDAAAVFRPSTGLWFLRSGFSTAWGTRGDIPVPADYDGDGTDNIAVYRPSNGAWYVRGGPYLQWGQGGDVPAPADFDGDGLVDIAVFRPSTGQWLIRGIGVTTWGRAGDVPVPMDLDRDGRAELIVFRPATGVWFVLHLASGATRTVQWGAAGDVPLGRVSPMPQWRPGDVDGDRRADLTVFRPSSTTWYASLSSTGYGTFTTATFGSPTGVPVAGDFDGDGRQDFVLFQSSGAWDIRLSSTSYQPAPARAWGAAGDVPIPADYDGDGVTDLAVFRPSSGRWYVLFSASGLTFTMQWGLDGDIPRPADFDGDGRADPAVFRPSLGRWFIFNRFTGVSTIRDWGLSGDVPFAADFDGDRRADVAVYRPAQGRWYILRSTTAAYTPVDWGLEADVPVPLDFDGDGITDIAVYRPSTGRWFVRGWLTKDWGLAGDVPVPATR